MKVQQWPICLALPVSYHALVLSLWEYRQMSCAGCSDVASASTSAPQAYLLATIHNAYGDSANIH